MIEWNSRNGRRNCTLLALDGLEWPYGYLLMEALGEVLYIAITVSQ